jgi:hypothetical protein
MDQPNKHNVAMAMAMAMAFARLGEYVKDALTGRSELGQQNSSAS